MKVLKCWTVPTVFLAFLLCFPLPALPEIEREMKEFLSTRYSLLRPAGWEARSQGGVGVRFVPAECAFTNCGFSVLCTKSSISLKNYDAAFAANAKHLGHTMISAKDVRLSGVDARRREYTGTKDDKPFKRIRIYAIKHGLLCDIGFTHSTEKFDDYQLTVERMIKSFKIAN